MTLRLFIVDDEAPARLRLKTLLSDIMARCPHVLVGEADNAQNALDGIAATLPDIVLLDIHMPNMTGIALAKHITAQQATLTPAFIFITAYDEHALQAFEVHAFDYLLKPVRAARLAEAILRISALRSASTLSSPSPTASLSPAGRQHFSIQERGRLFLLPTTDIIYFKAELKYLSVRTKTHVYLIEESLLALEAELAATFIRVHRNALVARNAIIGVERPPVIGHDNKEYETWQVILRDVAERLPISRRQWPAIKSLIKN